MDNSYSVIGDRNQAVQGNNNQVTQNNQEDISDKEQLTPAQVVELLAEIEKELKQLVLTESVKEKAIRRLKCAAEDIQEKEPDKQSAANNLKRFGETMGEARKASEEIKKLLENIKPACVEIARWLKVPIAYLFGSLL